MTKRETKLWKKDSIACMGERKNIYYKLLKKTDGFIGVSKENIEKYLGIPNVKKTGNATKKYYYFVEKGSQCLYVDKNGYDTLNVEVLFVFFDKTYKVTRIGGMKP